MTESARPLTRLVDGRLAPIAGTWELDGLHTCTGFGVRHLLTLMRGRFRDQAGTIVIADDPAASSVEVTIQAASIDTGHPKANESLLGEGFLDVERHPTITFRSSAVSPAENGRWNVDGELTVRGVSRPVRLDTVFLGAVTHPFGGTAKMSLQARTAIARADFGVGADYPTPDGPGVLVVGNRIELTIDIEADLVTG
ncbi:MAG: YceI family protein [Acidimicrobiia bacterium]|nr:YceI family protein [Acidimicrobiia bacterium]